jgi:UDP-N-acetylmuramoyl-L-alanine---L-glutamate ligase
MRHPISWSQLSSATVGVWGLGVEGTASLRRLRELGAEPVLVEDTPAAPSFDGVEVRATAGGGLEALLRCDVVIKSPGISRYRAEVGTLEAAGVAVRSGLGLWLEDTDRSRVACITGTKGKSTTTALAVHLLGRLGVDARAGGNIGHAPWDPEAGAGAAGPGPGPDYWIIETSSFQVPELTTGPSVAAVTSLSPDHLDWHGSVERYYADKLSLCAKPGVRTALADGADLTLRANAEFMGPGVHWVDEPGPAGWQWTEDLALPGRHNVRNAAMARAVLVALGITGADDDERMADALHGFAGLPSRCQSLGFIGRTEFVDDSLSTNVLPAQAALEAFADRPVALLVGGHDRGVDYAPLGEAVALRQEPTLVVTMPDNGPRIGAAVRAAVGNGAGAPVEVVDTDDLDAAVALATTWASAGGVVLLSPAAPSFGRFSDYRARAQAFADAAARGGPLRPEPAPRAR